MVNLVEEAKRQAAYQAVDNHILDTDRVIGIGSGSTVVYAVERILQRAPEKNKNLVFIPTSFQSQLLIVEGGLTLGDLDRYPEIDVCIDGADEVDSQLNAIKGGGAAQLREKVVAAAAKRFVIVADFRKNSDVLGKQWKKGVPIEVVPFAYKPVQQKIKAMGGEAKLRMGGNKAGPVVTDNGNFVLDADFGLIENPAQLEKDLIIIPGILEVGLFINMAQIAYFGNEDGTVASRKL
ncbi:ribose-5-phosphate isomerase rki1, variant 2 [Basidiobolus ranarum]